MKDACKNDGKVSITEVIGSESTSDANMRNGSVNRAVVNRKGVWVQTPQRPYTRVVNTSVETSKSETLKTSRDQKLTMTVQIRAHLKSLAKLLMIQMVVLAFKIVLGIVGEGVRTRTLERSYTRPVDISIQNQAITTDSRSDQNYVNFASVVPQHADFTATIACPQTLGVSPTMEDSKGSDKENHCKIFDTNGLDEKYLASILIQTPKKKLWANSDNRMVKAWRDQTDFEFGFIPLSDLQGADTHYFPIVAHKVGASFKKPNHLGARVKVDTQLNLQEWYDQLQDYWDQQLFDFLTFGFPLDFNRSSPLHWEGGNHKSALDHPDDIDAYLQEEISFKAIVGPFPKHPSHNGHISPFMTRDKPGSKNRRVIIDLSWPLRSSVNTGIDKDSYMGTDFVLVLPTVDNITDQLKALGRVAHLYKIDISRAFRYIKVDPLDYDLLGLHWHDVYIDICVPFGSHHGSQSFQHISDAVRHIMRRHGHKFITYVDDYFGFCVLSDAIASFDLLFDLLQKLGLTVSQKKASSTCHFCGMLRGRERHTYWYSFNPN